MVTESKEGFCQGDHLTSGPQALRAFRTRQRPERVDKSSEYSSLGNQTRVFWLASRRINSQVWPLPMYEGNT